MPWASLGPPACLEYRVAFVPLMEMDPFLLVFVDEQGRVVWGLLCRLVGVSHVGCFLCYRAIVIKCYSGAITGMLPAPPGCNNCRSPLETVMNHEHCKSRAC